MKHRDRGTGLKTSALYVVATPLGNLGDIGARALEVLRGADAVACEDTRHTRRLLDHFGIRAETFSLHEHNEAATAEKLIRLLREGRTLALVSDAGTPAVSDPGARAVAAVRAAGFAVVPVPGPNAAIAALSASGLTDPHFLFYGFLPAKQAARRGALADLKPLPCALVFYEAPHRIEETVADLVAVLEPGRTLVIARELTKLFESIVSLPLAEAPAWLAAAADRRRGEFVLAVSAPPPAEGVPAEAARMLDALLAALPLKQAVKLAAEISGASKNALYDLALEKKRAD
ncbi:MAG TPA: 16S rRNA (cytidine(1402)-2'-O)-methyltransferase [Candidatus Desulfobacillus denitrificans]|jgi:16S rRNA (cytidine1402-2'-O)-methyltransferase|nr:16S rRNA (cytidine(1402)-2'-O)-methyltransferase [Candidatus Desulfobacillus denitrificans]HNT63599.1 16S rRNA (cytidine(1402)-2'-O)-methyltransferase [Candidatus Desulfobacillus denitrificans]